MKLEFDSMLDLLVPGEHQYDHQQFGVRQALLDELDQVDAAFGEYVVEQLRETWNANGSSMISPSALRIKLYTMLQEMTHPQGMNEVIYCGEVSGYVLRKASEALLANAERSQGHYSNQTPLSTFFIDPHATA